MIKHFSLEQKHTEFDVVSKATELGNDAIHYFLGNNKYIFLWLLQCYLQVFLNDTDKY